MRHLNVLWIDDDWDDGDASGFGERFARWESDWRMRLAAQKVNLTVARRSSGNIADDLTRNHVDALICDYKLDARGGHGDRNAFELIDRLREGIRKDMPPTVLFTRYRDSALTSLVQPLGMLKGVYSKDEQGAKNVFEFLLSLALSEPINLLVISDLHMGYLPRSHPAGGSLSQRDYSDRLLDSIRRTAQGTKLHALVCPGDFAWHNQREDFKHAVIEVSNLMHAAGLRSMEQFLFCPGNHDVYYADDTPSWSEYRDFVTLLSGSRGKDFLSRFTAAWDHVLQELGDFSHPSAMLSIVDQVPPGFLFAGLNSCMPTNVRFRCEAGIDPKQWQYIKSRTALEGSAGLRIAAMHHPVFSSPGGFWDNEQPVKNQGVALNKLASLGFGLVFHGHTHFAGVHNHRVRVINGPGHEHIDHGDKTVASILTVACPSVVAEPDPSSPMRQYMVVRIGSLDRSTHTRSFGLDSHVFNPARGEWLKGEGIPEGEYSVQTLER